MAASPIGIGFTIMAYNVLPVNMIIVIDLGNLCAYFIFCGIIVEGDWILIIATLIIWVGSSAG